MRSAEPQHVLASPLSGFAALTPTYKKYCAKFADAKQLCRELRADKAPGDKDDIRMAFAEDEAKRLFSDKRQPASPLEEREA